MGPGQLWDGISIAVFGDSSAQRSVLVKNPPQSGKALLEGPNWIIWTNQDTWEKIQDKLGGEFRTDPGSLAVDVNMDLKFGVLWVSRTESGPGRRCYGSGGGLAKDLGPDSMAYIESASGLTVSAKLSAGKALGDVCKITYRLNDVVGGDGPYEVQVGGRKAGSYSEAQLRAGINLQVG